MTDSYADNPCWCGCGRASPRSAFRGIGCTSRYGRNRCSGALRRPCGTECRTPLDTFRDAAPSRQQFSRQSVSVPAHAVYHPDHSSDALREKCPPHSRVSTFQCFHHRQTLSHTGRSGRPGRGLGLGPAGTPKTLKDGRWCRTPPVPSSQRRWHTRSAPQGATPLDPVRPDSTASRE